MLFDVRNTTLRVPFDVAFDYISDSANLVEWTHAFAEVDEHGTALMRTPNGETKVDLRVDKDHESGIIDWYMTFPDGTVGAAYSRLIALAADSCAYSFVLTAPPVALEAMEGALAEQSAVLERELTELKKLLETP